MMQMLLDGGMSVLADNSRRPDLSNPRGYYEFGRVKSLPDDTSWLPIAVGKAVKIVSTLLPALPQGQRYDIIFMKRDLREVAASQQRMLEIQGQAPMCDEVTLCQIFAKHLQEIFAYLARRVDIRMLYVDYNALVCNARPWAERVNAFLEQDLDVNRMVAAVDQSLYRNRLLPAPD